MPGGANRVFFILSLPGATIAALVLLSPSLPLNLPYLPRPCCHLPHPHSPALPCPVLSWPYYPYRPVKALTSGPPDDDTRTI